MAKEAQRAAEITGDEELQRLYNWVDEIPLSRPKKNISRDFADGVLAAEILNHFFPKLVEMHNYSAANSYTQKMYNWTTLNTKVLKKIGHQIHQQDLEDVIKVVPHAVEKVLVALQDKIGRVQRRDHQAGGEGRVRAPSSGAAIPRASQGSRDIDSRGGRGEQPLHQGRDVGQSDRGRSGGGRESEVRQVQQEVDAEMLLEKEQTIAELREMVVIMSEKIKKLEQLVRIKDTKIEALQRAGR